MVMTSDETRIQISANWPMSHAKRVTRDNRKNPEYHVVAAIRKTVDRHKMSRRTENHGQTMLKMSSISDLKRPVAPKNTGQFNIMVQRTPNENAAVYVESVTATCTSAISKEPINLCSEWSHRFLSFPIIRVTLNH